MLGAHCLKSWSTTQPTISLSSGEAEFYGLVKAAGVGLGYKALLKDFGYDLPVTAWTDSSAAMGVVGRQGLGRLRHLDTHSLWIQQAVRCGKITVRKVKGEDNVADLFTKHLASRDRINYLMGLLGCAFVSGRPEAAPLMRRERLDKQTLGEAAGLGSRFPARKAGNVVEEFGVEDPELEDFIANIVEASDVPNGKLPHQVSNLDEAHPKLVCNEDAEGNNFEDYDNGQTDKDFLERIGSEIASEIAREARESGRRRYSSSNLRQE